MPGDLQPTLLLSYCSYVVPSYCTVLPPRDNELLDGRPMYISECGQNKKEGGAGFKFKTELEKNKLFVRGIDLAVTQEEVIKHLAVRNTTCKL